MSESETPTFLDRGGIRQRMRCSASVAHNIEEAFVTAEQLVAAVESDTPLTETDGIGPKTADVIRGWWEHREDREATAKSATTTRTSDTSLPVSFHPSWADALDIDADDAETVAEQGESDS